MSIPRNLSVLALNISAGGVLSVAGGGTGVSTSTGTGANVLSTSPTLVTPLLGTPTSGNFSTGTFTWPTFNQNTTGTAAGLSAILSASSGGTGAATLAGASIVTYNGVETLTNKRITSRILADSSNSTTPTINTDNYDMFIITGQSAAITSFTTNLTGTPTNGQKLWISITGTTAITITWGAKFEASIAPLPTTTTTTARLDVGFVWNAVTTTWRCIATA